ncbi:MAG: hypothetical protein A2Y57_00490 [Candidatus Woykebacteria bacterium RBG_13_40_7b]|uniref:Uncharacterized protein n=1 Tax=Candidatus Woykebacteria bacterium RBG_13_40_7b TaxID=1802594 RepID=A0A1G1WAJ4_9BACT|nr:MAG: hypothetical protein A2Y57_00490 [Candidatus Woykebacteria bacterium RBG_13_40_7b]
MKLSWKEILAICVLAILATGLSWFIQRDFWECVILDAPCGQAGTLYGWPIPYFFTYRSEEVVGLTSSHVLLIDFILYFFIISVSWKLTRLFKFLYSGFIKLRILVKISLIISLVTVFYAIGLSLWSSQKSLTELKEGVQWCHNLSLKEKCFPFFPTAPRILPSSPGDI